MYTIAKLGSQRLDFLKGLFKPRPLRGLASGVYLKGHGNRAKRPTHYRVLKGSLTIDDTLKCDRSVRGQTMEPIYTGFLEQATNLTSLIGSKARAEGEVLLL
jgi:hypothetical protein